MRVCNHDCKPSDSCFNYSSVPHCYINNLSHGLPLNIIVDKDISKKCIILFLGSVFFVDVCVLQLDVRSTLGLHFSWPEYSSFQKLEPPFLLNNRPRFTAGLQCDLLTLVHAALIFPRPVWIQLVLFPSMCAGDIWSRRICHHVSYPLASLS